MFFQKLKDVVPARRQQILTVLGDYQQNKSLIMLCMFLHQHVESDRLFKYLIKNEITGKKLAETIVGDFNCQFYNFINSILEK